MSNLSYRQFPGFAKHEGVSMNQMALPGMEEHAHPGASTLAQGYRFEHSQGRSSNSRNGGVMRHTLSAVPDGGHSQWDGVSDLTWASSHHPYTYPGEIEGVFTNKDHQRRGLARSLFRVAREMDFGQDTVPVHSPDRSPQGQKWSSAVGGPRPPRGVPVAYRIPYSDDRTGPMKSSRRWDLPEGIHPFQKDEVTPYMRFNKEPKAPQAKGQKRFKL